MAAYGYRCVTLLPLCLLAPALTAEGPPDPVIRVRVVEPPPAEHSASTTVSTDLLRHPLPRKARPMLQKALKNMDAGDHRAAIKELQATLAKYPSAAPYVHSLLGYEYLVTDQFASAVECFEQAVQLLPHDPANQMNLGISLAGLGDYGPAEEHVRRAAELDPANPRPKQFLEALVGRRQRSDAMRASGTPQTPR